MKVEVKELTRRYGKHTALDKVRFTLETGRIYGLLGVNGAGKTTTLQLISGYLEPSSGEVCFDGVPMKKKPAACKALVGYLPEIPPLYPELTVEEFLRFQAEMRHIPKGKRENAVEEALRRGGLLRVRKRLIGHLSKGFRQRVGLAYVMMGDPRVLLLDEPTNGLDPVQIVTMREMLRELKKDKALVVSSHVLAEIRQIADEYLILADGKLVLSGSREELAGDREEDLEEAFLRVTRETYARAAEREALEEQMLLEEEAEEEEDSDD